MPWHQCGWCGAPRGTYSDSCAACRRRRDQSEQQRNRRTNGQEHRPAIRLTPQQAVEAAKAIDTISDARNRLRVILKAMRDDGHTVPAWMTQTMDALDSAETPLGRVRRMAEPLMEDSRRRPALRRGSGEPRSTGVEQ